MSLRCLFFLFMSSSFDDLIDLQDRRLDVGVVGGCVDALGLQLLHDVGLFLRAGARAEDPFCM